MAMFPILPGWHRHLFISALCSYGLFIYAALLYYNFMKVSLVNKLMFCHCIGQTAKLLNLNRYNITSLQIYLLLRRIP